MRIADKMQFEQVKTNIAKNRSQMSELQNQAATQKRVTKPSDDPLAASHALTSKSDLAGSKQYIKNLNYARSFIEVTDQSLGDLTNVLMRAKELALSQANDGSANQESRRAVATEMEQLSNAMLNIGNRKLGDRFIFGGFRTQHAPFTANGEYHGDGGEMNIHVDKESFVPMNIPGGRAFLGVGVDPDGMVKQGPPQARTIEELEKQEQNQQIQQQAPLARGIASVTGQELPIAKQEDPTGINLFGVLRDLEISLRTDDKEGIQDSLDQLDAALSQVILTRSQVGARGAVLDSWMQSLEKSKIESQTTISALEDADVFSTVNDISKTQSTLQATLQTSGKLIQPSLLEFLR